MFHYLKIYRNYILQSLVQIIKILGSIPFVSSISKIEIFIMDYSITLLEIYTDTIYPYRYPYQNEVFFILYLSNERLFSFVVINFQPISNFYKLLLFCLLLIIDKNILFVVSLLKMLKYFLNVLVSVNTFNTVPKMKERFSIVDVSIF